MDNLELSAENKRTKIESKNSESQEDLEKQTRGKRKRKESKEPNASQEDFERKFTDSEKIYLFNAIIQHGSSNISLLHSYVPTKSKDNIRRFMLCHKRVARYTISEGRTKAPIDKWLDFLISESGSDREKLNDLSRALKYIALFEPSVESESMLSDCYNLLSECMKGEAPKHLNPVTSLFLHGQMQQVIRIFKTQDFNREHKYLETYKKKTPCYYSGKRKARVNDNNVDDSRISNPLKIPDSLFELKK